MWHPQGPRSPCKLGQENGWLTCPQGGSAGLDITQQSQQKLSDPVDGPGSHHPANSEEVAGSTSETGVSERG